MIAELLADPLLRHVLVMLWLLPCAIQDRRNRHISNWLTAPLFIVSWPVAIVTDTFPLTFAFFVGVYVTSRLEPGFGAADGKLMVGLAAFAPLSLGIAVLLEGLVFVLLRLRRRRAATIPGALWLYTGALLNVTALVIRAGSHRLLP